LLGRERDWKGEGRRVEVGCRKVGRRELQGKRKERERQSEFKGRAPSKKRLKSMVKEVEEERGKARRRGGKETNR